MAITISIFNMKGGVGKTTLTTTLAHFFASFTKFRKKSLVVDLDIQNNSTQYLLGIDRYQRMIKSNRKTVVDVFEQDSFKGSIPLHKDVILNVKRYNSYSIETMKVDLVPARIELMKTLRNPNGKEHHLNNWLGNLKNQYDVILIDCPPTESVLNEAAYLASDYILVPVVPEYLPVLGLPLFLESYQGFKKKYPGSNLSIAGLVINQTTQYAPEETESIKEIQEFGKVKGLHVFYNVIKYSRSYPRSAREASGIFDTPRVRDTVKENLRNFAFELAERIRLV